MPMEDPVTGKRVLYGPATHCSKLEILLNKNVTPQNQQFLLVYTLVLPKESRSQKSVNIQGLKQKIRLKFQLNSLKLTLLT